MRANFSEKVDKFILSKSLTPLMEEAINTIKDENIINDMLTMSSIKIPELSNINTSVYLNRDRHNYIKLGDSAELLGVKHSQNVTPEQIDKYKEFLKEYNKAWVAKMKYLISVELINIFGSTGEVGINGLYKLKHIIQQSDTYGAKLYRVVNAFSYYYIGDKLSEILDLDMYIDESKADGNVTVMPATLDAILDSIRSSNMDLTEGVYYQNGDDDAYHDVEPYVDGIDAPLLIMYLLDVISDSIVVGNNFNLKAKQNIEDALNRVSKFMVTLPLATKMTEVEVINIITANLLNNCKRIPDNGLCDSFVIKLVDECRDIDPELLAQDIINYSKFAAKYFKDIYDNDKPGEMFPAVHLTENGDIKNLSGISPDNFAVNYFNINNLGLASYVVD